MFWVLRYSTRETWATLELARFELQLLASRFCEARGIGSWINGWIKNGSHRGFVSQFGVESLRPTFEGAQLQTHRQKGELCSGSIAFLHFWVAIILLDVARCCCGVIEAWHDVLISHGFIVWPWPAHLGQFFEWTPLRNTHHDWGQLFQNNKGARNPEKGV